MKRTRFVAPAREALAAGVFDHPIFAAVARHRDLLDAAHWPALEALNKRLIEPGLRFVAQDEGLLRDGLHYETRIHDHGCIATRERNWHDLFNALIWIQHAALKRALNLRQVADILRCGPQVRTRAQCALTHFDEAGAVVWLDDAALLEAWDAHDWRTWFGQQEAFAQGRIRIHIFGHALLEHMLYPERLPTAKCLVLCGGDPADWCSTLAETIAAGKLLNDPQELRPLPLAGIPGWSAGQHAAEFFDGDAFRPRRADRCYPMPWRAATDAAVPA